MCSKKIICVLITIVIIILLLYIITKQYNNESFITNITDVNPSVCNTKINQPTNKPLPINKNTINQ